MSSGNPIAGKVGSFLLAVMLAVFIWLTATQDQDPINDQFIQLGVDFKGQPAESIRIQPQSTSVQVRLEGPESALRQLSPQDFEAYADLSQVPFGENIAVPIRINPPSEDVKITLIIPDEVNVLLEEQVSREIPVELDIRGGTARGHTQGEPLLEPAFITVSGPRSKVENLDFALVTVFLNNPRETSVGQHRPVFYDAQGRVASTVDLELDTQDIQVTIPIEQSAGFAEKLITVNWIGDPAYGHQLLNVSVDPPSVLVVGPPETVNALTSLQTEPIDITGLTESFIQPATLDLPDGITLDQNQEIFVTIDIEPILSTDTRRRQVEILGLEEDLEAELTPEQVSVVLHGPLPVLDSLVSEDVRVTVDLFDLGSGRYSIEPQVDIPDRGIQVRSIQPSAISVFITKTLTTTLDITGTVPITGTGNSLITDTLPIIPGTTITKTYYSPQNAVARLNLDYVSGDRFEFDQSGYLDSIITFITEKVQSNLIQLIELSIFPLG
jgi:YbbR domain-containing protein